MNRRAFLTGLIAGTAIAACPAAVEAALTAAPEVEWKNWFDKWYHDVATVHARVWEDQIIYGVGATRVIDTYPFIERVDPRDLPAPKPGGGLLT